MFEIGQVLTKANYTAAAVWCNANSAHIEKQNGAYVIVANAPAPEPTAEEQLRMLESQTGLTRAVREMVLAEGSGASGYVKEKTRELEALASALRAQKVETEEEV